MAVDAASVRDVGFAAVAGPVLLAERWSQLGSEEFEYLLSVSEVWLQTEGGLRVYYVLSRCSDLFCAIG